MGSGATLASSLGLGHSDCGAYSWTRMSYRAPSWGITVELKSDWINMSLLKCVKRVAGGRDGHRRQAEGATRAEKHIAGRHREAPVSAAFLYLARVKRTHGTIH